MEINFVIDFGIAVAIIAFSAFEVEALFLTYKLTRDYGKRALGMAIKNHRQVRRYTDLAAKLKQAVGP